MKQTIGLSDFHDAFRRAGRTEQFSSGGLDVLFDYLEGIEFDSGEEIELDVVALCCEFAEASPEEIAQNYSIDLSDIDEEDKEELREAVLKYVGNHSIVAGETKWGDIVYQQF